MITESEIIQAFLGLASLGLSATATILAIKVTYKTLKTKATEPWLLLAYSAFLLAIAETMNAVNKFIIISDHSSYIISILGALYEIFKYSYIALFLIAIFIELKLVEKIADVGVKAKLEITPAREESIPEKMKYELKEGEAYLIKSRKLAFDVFRDRVVHGSLGLCITRTFPENVREQYGLRRTPILWLTKEEGENCITPPHLGKIDSIVSDFFAKTDRSVLLLDGIEYLIVQNSFKTVLRMIQILRDKVALKNSLLLIPLDIETFDKRELKLLCREMMFMQE